MKPINCLLLATMLLFLFSCKKDKKKDCTLTEANFAGSYKITTVRYKQTASSPEVDGKSLLLDACQQDDFTTFKTDHTYTVTDAGTKCDPPSDDNGTWSLTGSTITIDGDATAVQNYSCSGFTITETDVVTDGDSGTITFARQ